MRRIVLCIIGPTASGKTSVALDVAKSLDAEVISADSRQVYKYLDIGTAKPSIEQRRQVRHYFIDELDPGEDFNAGEFGKRGRAIIEDIFRRKKVPLVVGGSGLYVQSLIDGFFEGPPRDEEIRERLYRQLEEGGVEALLQKLKRVDPVSANKMLPSNTRRIIRALEVHEITGSPISALQEQKAEITFTPLLVGLSWDRKLLYARINERVDSMLKAGLIEEVKKLKKMGYTERLNSLQTVGYQEAFRYLSGEIDYDTMVELIKRNSRRFAKRQLTWFRRDKRIHWIPMRDESDFPTIAQEIVKLYRSAAA